VCELLAANRQKPKLAYSEHTSYCADFLKLSNHAKLDAPANRLELEARREDAVFLTARGLGVPACGSK
jgi:hypothetical protein